jgi:hypothetical protein
MAAEVDGQGASVKVGVVRSLFAINLGGARSGYDVSLDGQRFLVNTLPGQEATRPPPITVVSNWMAGLRK